MSRFLVFIGVAVLILGGIHWYLWARLVRDTHLPSPWGGLATAALALLAVGMPLAMFLGRASFPTGRIVAWPAFVWMGLMFLLLVGVSAADLVRLAAWLVRRAQEAGPPDPERRIA